MPQANILFYSETVHSALTFALLLFTRFCYEGMGWGELPLTPGWGLVGGSAG